MKRKFKPIWWLVSAGALAAAAAYGSWQYGLSTATPDSSVTTVIVREDHIVSSVLATGIVRPQKLTALGAQVTGRILRLEVKPGQRVRRGDVVALIDSTNQENELLKAEAILRQSTAARAQALADLELAKSDLSRIRVMVDRNSIAHEERDRATANLKVKEAQVASSDAAVAVSEVDVKIAQANLGFTRITAPADATVLKTLVQEGQTVNAQQTAPTIAILGRLDQMTVEVNISEADIGKLHEGMPLFFTISGQAEKKYEAFLETIEPAPDAIASDRSFQTAGAASSKPDSSAIYYKGVVSVANPDNALKTYMTAEVHIAVAARDALIVPNTVLLDTDRSGQAIVFVKTERSVERRTVQIGITDKVRTEILSGLSQGEQVVLNPEGMLAP